MILTKKEKDFIEQHEHLLAKDMIYFLEDGESLAKVYLTQEEIENLYTYYLNMIEREKK